MDIDLPPPVVGDSFGDGFMGRLFICNVIVVGIFIWLFFDTVICSVLLFLAMVLECYK